MEQESFGERLLNRLLCFVSGAFAVLIAVIYCQGTTLAVVTLGTLADKRNDFSGRRVVIQNAGNGKIVGRFIYFDADVIDRHNIVLTLSVDKVEPGITTFRAYVVGVESERIPGCDHDPPFLYIIDGRPINSDP